MPRPPKHREVQRQAHLPDKRITVQVVRHNIGWTMERVVVSRPAILNDQHTVQQAVRAVYPLPGECHNVALRRGTVDVDNMWWPWAGGERHYQQDWYPRIQEDDVVEIAILFSQDQEVHRGPGERLSGRDIWGPDTEEPWPAAHARGPDGQDCRCVPCSLAALLSLG